MYLSMFALETIKQPKTMAQSHAQFRLPAAPSRVIFRKPVKQIVSFRCTGNDDTTLS